MSAATQTVTPQAERTESTLMGGLLMSPEMFDHAAGILQPSDLYRQSHRILWQAMSQLRAEGRAWDMIVMADYLKSRGTLEQVGGYSYIAELVSGIGSLAMIPHYCRVVLEAGVRRDIQSHAKDVADRIEEEPPAEFAAWSSERLREISARLDTDSGSFKSDVTTILAETIDQWEAGRKHGTSTGYPVLDGLTSGLQPSDLIVLAARPSIGKTAIGLNIVDNILRRGESASFVSLEMSRRQVILRLVSVRSGVPFQRLLHGAMNELEVVTRAGNILATQPLSLTDRPAMSIAEIHGFARNAIKANGPGPLFVDYLGMIRTDGNHENRNLQVGEITAGLKMIAKDLNIPVVALSQLNRDSDKHGTRRPRLTDLRDSGNIEQDADLVLLLHREDRGARDGILDVAKQRNGPTGEVALVFNGPVMRFEEVKPVEPFGGGPSL